MEYTDAFMKKNEWLKTLDKETLNDELNKMTTDELFMHMECMIRETLGSRYALTEEEIQEQINKLLQLTRDPE